MLDVIHISLLTSKITKSLDLLRATYRNDGSQGGWYHYLDSSHPGPTASACAMLCFAVAGVRFEHERQVLVLLKARQIASSDIKQAGGWPLNTTGSQPLVEASGWVMRYLGLSARLLEPESPDILSGYKWLVENQNSDYGWGSFFGQPSRVYLTCLALRALGTFDSSSQAVLSGIDWLSKNKSGGSSGWGSTLASPPTVLHTSFVLLTLMELGIDANVPFVKDAYQWLVENITPDQLYEPRSQVEEYEVVYQEKGIDKRQQVALAHFALPVALSALICGPYGLESDIVYRGLCTILDKQQQNGAWENARNPARLSIWAVWHFVQALTDVTRLPLLRTTYSVSRISTSLVVKTQSSGIPVFLVIIMDMLLALGNRIMEYWSGIVLILFASVGLILNTYRVFELKDIMLSLAVPIALVFVQIHLENKGRKKR